MDWKQLAKYTPLGAAYQGISALADYGVRKSGYMAPKDYSTPRWNTVPTSTPSSSPTIDVAAILRELDAKYPSRSYSSPAPTLPEYKPMNYTYDQAKSEAAPSVNAYYDKTLQDYLKTVETRKTRAQEDLATAMGQYDTQGKYLGEDYSTRLANLATGAELSGKAEAQSATANRAGLKTGLATAGLIFSGIGKEQLNQQDAARRLSLAAATAQLNQEKASAETTKVRGMESIESGKKSAKTATSRIEQDLMTEQEQKREDLEYQRSADIAEKASQLYSQKEKSWAAENPYWANYFA